MGDWVPSQAVAVKALSVLGSTGSIGTQTLEIVEEFPQRFRVVALTAGRNLALLCKQVQRHQPEVVALADPALLPELQERLSALNLPRLPELLAGSEGLCQAAAWSSADLVVTGIVGCAGLLPTLAAIEAGKDLALANKETLIAAGPVVLPAPACCRHRSQQGALAGAAAQDHFRHQHRQANHQHDQHIQQQKRPAAPLGGAVGKAPKVPQANGTASRRQHKAQTRAPLLPRCHRFSHQPNAAPACQ